MKFVGKSLRNALLYLAITAMIMGLASQTPLATVVTGTPSVYMQNGAINSTSLTVNANGNLTMNGGQVINATTWSGTSFPTGTLNASTQFFRSDLGTLYIYNGSAWNTVTASTVANSYTISVSGSTYYAVSTNGNSPYVGTNFTKVREQALASVVAQGGGTIFYKAGKYYTANTLLTNSLVDEIGDGMDATTITRTADVILYNFTETQAGGTSANEQRCLLEGMTLCGEVYVQGQNMQYTSDMVYIYQLKDSIFNDLHIANETHDGFYITGTLSNSFWNTFETMLMDNPLGQNTGSAFYLGNKALDSYIYNVWGGGWKYDVQNAGGATDWDIDRMWLTNAVNVVNFRSDTWFGAFYFNNIWFDAGGGSSQATGCGIVLNATNAGFGDISFENLFFIGMWTNLDLVRIDSSAGQVGSDIYFLNLHGSPTRTNSAIINWTGSGTIQSMTIDQDHLKGTTNRYVGTFTNSIHIVNDDYLGFLFSGLPFTYTVYTSGGTYYAINQTTGLIEISGSNATQVITNSSNNAHASGGGIIFITQGIYYMTATILQPSDVALEGEGPLNTILKPQGAFNAINVSYAGDQNGTDFAIENLQIDMSGYNGTSIYSASATHTTTQRNPVISNVRIVNVNSTYSGIYLINPSSMSMNDVSINTNGTGITFVNDGTLGAHDGDGNYQNIRITLGNNGSTGLSLQGNSTYPLSLMTWDTVTVYVPTTLSGNTCGINLTAVQGSSFRQIDVENTNVSVYLGQSSNVYTQDNTFEESDLYKSQNFTVWLASGSFHNTFVGGAWSTVSSAYGYIVYDANSYSTNNRTFNLVQGVDLGSGLKRWGWCTRFSNCPDYSPVGLIAKPFANINNLNFSGPYGFNSAPYNNTLTMVAQCDQYMTFAGGSGVNITILDPNLNQLQTGLATLTMQYFPVGFWLIEVYTTAPTVTDWGFG